MGRRARLLAWRCLADAVGAGAAASAAAPFGKKQAVSGSGWGKSVHLTNSYSSVDGGTSGVEPTTHSGCGEKPRGAGAGGPRVKPLHASGECLKQD